MQLNAYMTPYNFYENMFEKYFFCAYEHGEGEKKNKRIFKTYAEQNLSDESIIL